MAIAAGVDVERLGAELEAAAAGWGGTGEALLDSGLVFGDGEPVRVRVRKRHRRYDLDDAGRAVAKAGKPRGWLEAARQGALEEHLNVNRAGVVFVGAVEGRDLARLAAQVAGAALAVHGALVELGD